MTTLLALLGGAPLPRTLARILEEVIADGNVRLAAEQALRRRLRAQEGRTAGNHLGHAILEQVDEAMETRPEGATLDQRVEIGTRLAQAASVQLAEAAEVLLSYPVLQAAVVRAKSEGDPAALKAARQARDAGAERVKQALIDVGRVSAGDAPRDL